MAATSFHRTSAGILGCYIEIRFGIELARGLDERMERDAADTSKCNVLYLL
jgi:hypothetical protein